MKRLSNEQVQEKYTALLEAGDDEKKINQVMSKYNLTRKQFSAQRYVAVKNADKNPTPKRREPVYAAVINKSSMVTTTVVNNNIVKIGGLEVEFPNNRFVLNGNEITW